MRRDLYHYFKGDIESVYNAYVAVLRAEPFHKEPNLAPYSLISFGLGMSFKFNMNGGTVHIHLAPRGTGTAIQVRYSIVQLVGARYRAYDKLLTDHVAAVLGYAAEPLEELADAYFEASSAQPALTETKAIEVQPVEVVAEEVEEVPAPTGRPQFCGKCGKRIDPEDNYCGSCGAKIE